jgi:hypothetical protein
MSTNTDFVYDYKVSFVGDDTTVTVTVTDEHSEMPIDEAETKATALLMSMWGVDDIPQAYYLVTVSEPERIEL